MINAPAIRRTLEDYCRERKNALKKFEAAQMRASEVHGGAADDLRSRSTRNIALIKGYLDEIRQHKLRRLAGLSKNEELRAWQEFVTNRRSSRVHQMIDED